MKKLKTLEGISAVCLLLSKIQVPILIIHGEKDKAVPLRFSKFLAKSHQNIKLILLSGAEHKFEDYFAQKKLIKITAEWFKEKLWK